MSAKKSPITAELVQAKLRSLKLAFPEDIPIQWESMFGKIEGWGTRSYIKRKHKLISVTAPFLRKLLKPNETVLYVGKGMYSSFIESFLMGGWLSTVTNQTVFVLTDLRLIMLHSNSSGVPSRNFWMIFYNQISKFKGSMTGTVKLQLKDGKSLTFAGFESLDRKQMPKVFEEAIELYESLQFNPSASQSRENLCSYCYEIVPKKQFECNACGSQFWKPSQIALRSLIFPSWGDWILGHRIAAFIELSGYALGWFTIIETVKDAIQDGSNEAMQHAMIQTFAILAFAHGLDALLTYFVASKGLHLKVSPLKQTSVSLR